MFKTRMIWWALLGSRAAVLGLGTGHSGTVKDFGEASGQNLPFALVTSAMVHRIEGSIRCKCENIAGLNRLCRTNRLISGLPFPRTDLAYWLSDRYAQSRVAVEDGDADLDVRDLPFKVRRPQRLAD